MGVVSRELAVLLALSHCCPPFRHEDFRAALPASWVGQMEQRERITYGMQTTFKEELRFELLYDVARSIGDLAYNELFECHPQEPRHSLTAALNLMSASKECYVAELAQWQTNPPFQAPELRQHRRTMSEGAEMSEPRSSSHSPPRSISELCPLSLHLSLYLSLTRASSPSESHTTSLSHSVHLLTLSHSLCLSLSASVCLSLSFSLCLSCATDVKFATMSTAMVEQ